MTQMIIENNSPIFTKVKTIYDFLDNFEVMKFIESDDIVYVSKFEIPFSTYQVKKIETLHQVSYTIIDSEEDVFSIALLQDGETLSLVDLIDYDDEFETNTLSRAISHLTRAINDYSGSLEQRAYSLSDYGSINSSYVFNRLTLINYLLRDFGGKVISDFISEVSNTKPKPFNSPYTSSLTISDILEEDIFIYITYMNEDVLDDNYYLSVSLGSKEVFTTELMYQGTNDFSVCTFTPENTDSNDYKEVLYGLYTYLQKQ